MDSKIISYLIVAILVGSSVYLGNIILDKTNQEQSPQETAELRAQVANLTKSLSTLESECDLLRDELATLSEKNLVNKTVTIGYLDHTTRDIQHAIDTKRFIEEIIEPDLNEYAAKLGYGLRFEFDIELVRDMMTFNRRFIELKGRGIENIIVGRGNAGVDVSLSYAASNGMVLVSATSSQWDLAIGQGVKERLFRLCPWDSYEGTSLGDLLWERGVQGVVVLQRGDSWGDRVFHDLRRAWWQLSQESIADSIRYDVSASDYTSYLQQLDTLVAEEIASGVDRERLAVVALCQREEAPQVLRQAAAYPRLMNVTWYGVESTANNTAVIEQAGQLAAQVGWVSLKPDMPQTDAYRSLSTRYESLIGRELDISSAYLYDSAMVLARSIVEAQSADGLKVGSVFPMVANVTYGVTGWCGLNSDHDRIPTPYGIWSYTTAGNGTVTSVKIGSLIPATYRYSGPW